MFAEIQYSGVMGEHLQTELLDYNQISPSYLTKFGTVAQSVTVLNSQITSATGKASGVPLPTRPSRERSHRRSVHILSTT